MHRPSCFCWICDKNILPSKVSLHWRKMTIWRIQVRRMDMRWWGGWSVSIHHMTSNRVYSSFDNNGFDMHISLDQFFLEKKKFHFVYIQRVTNVSLVNSNFCTWWLEGCVWIDSGMWLNQLNIMVESTCVVKSVNDWIVWCLRDSFIRVCVPASIQFLFLFPASLQQHSSWSWSGQAWRLLLWRQIGERSIYGTGELISQNSFKSIWCSEYLVSA